MTLKELLEKQRGEFEKIMPVADVEIRNGEWLVSQEEVKNFLSSSQSEILGFIREWAEENEHLDTGMIDVQNLINLIDEALKND